MDWLKNLSDGAMSIIVFCVMLVVLLPIAVMVAKRGYMRRAEMEDDLAAREMATIVEDVRTTGFGGVCIVLLLLTVAVTTFSYLSAATVFQQIASGVSLIGGGVLFGAGAVMGRTRTYRVYRSVHRVP